MSGPELQPDAQAAKEIFAEACDLPPGARGRVLDDCCAGNATLRTEVEALLRANDIAGRFLAEPAAALQKACTTPPDDLRADALPRYVNHFKLLRLLGEGGFGVVYLAEQEHPVRRTVALKIIKLGMDTGQVVARFEAERQALAMMDHPNIAKVFDAGATETGRPYFVMELMDGIPITEYCRVNRLTLKERLELFIPVCLAVGHAHQKGVIHRDIKPSNILVGTQDGKPVPKVIDFGVAKATRASLAERTEFTGQRQLIGTLEYMSPEQADLSNPAVDTRSDIYSLGVVLYELLTGTAPFPGESLRSKGYSEAQRILREVQPQKPSSRVDAGMAVQAPRGHGTHGGPHDVAVAGENGADRRRAASVLRGDLDWVVMKCLEKDRERRYATAAALADDLRHYLAGEPVSAGPATAVYRLRKFAVKHRAAGAAVLAIGIALVAAVVGTSTGLVHARAAQKRAEISEKLATQERNSAEAAQRRAEQNALAATREAGRATAVNDLLGGIFALAQPESGSGGTNASIDEVLRRASTTIGVILRNRPEEELVARTMLAKAADRVFLRDVNVEQLRRAHEISLSLPGGPHSARSLQLAAEWHLAMYTNNQGAQAAPTARATLADCRRELGERDPVTWDAMQACALCVSQTGAADECYPLLKQLVETARPQPEARTPERLGRYLCNLAACQRDRGEFAAATASLREAISLPGADSPDSILSHGWVTRELVECPDLPEALPLVESQIAAALRNDPRGTPTLAYRLADAGMLELRRGNATGAATAFLRAIDMSRSLRGRISIIEHERRRLWRLYGDPAFASGWRSGALRDQVICALDDLLRDYPPASAAPQEVGINSLRFTLQPWGAEDKAAPITGGLEQLKALREPAPGIYLLGLEVPRLADEPLRRANWLFFSPWTVEFRPVVRLDEIRMDNSPNDRDLTGRIGRPYETRQMPALALQDGLAIATGRPRRIQWFIASAVTRAVFPAGRFRFSVSSDDGARVWVDGRSVIDNWRPHPSETTDGQVELAAGEHEIRVDLFQETGGYTLGLQAAPMTAAARTTALALGGGVPQADSQAVWNAQLTVETPLEPVFPVLHASALARGGRFAEAAREFATIVRADPTVWPNSQMQAALLGYLGDATGWRAACRNLFDRFASNPDAVVRMEALEACCLTPEPPVEAPRMRTFLESNQGEQLPPERRAEFHLALGMGLYRVGDWRQAAEHLRQSLSALPQTQPARRATAEIFLSMSCERLALTQEARAALERADRLIETLPIARVDELEPGSIADWLACQTVRREAAATITH